MPRVCVVIGTRPEAIKLASVIAKLVAHQDFFSCEVVVTGQHRQMLDQVMDLFGIRADADLSVMSADQDLSSLTARILTGLSTRFCALPPDLILVQGDTTTTMAASLAAFYARVPVGHIEAGLRTGKPASPFPEEMNRRLTSNLASIHFAPTTIARTNLLAEAVPEQRIIVTGNTGVDALRLVLPKLGPSDERTRFPDGSRGILVTTHRREHFGPGIAAICGAIRQLAVSRADVHIVLPVHLNPNISGPIKQHLGGLENVRLIEPVTYDVLLSLLRNCEFVMTDSGGIQEEAPSFHKPVLILREETERPEAVEVGAAMLVGVEQRAIVEAAYRLLDDAQHYERMAKTGNPFGDGYASERIVAFLMKWFDREPAHIPPWSEFRQPPVDC